MLRKAAYMNSLSRRTTAQLHRAAKTAELLERLDDVEPADQQRVLDEIVLVNRPVAEAIATRYAGRGIALDDLRQTAYEGLVKAVRRFDRGKGYDLLSFAVPTIRGEIRRYFRDYGWIIRPPRRIQELQQRISRVNELLGQELCREPESEEIAAELGVESADYQAALEAYGCFHPKSLDHPKSSDESRTIGDFIAADRNDELATEARLVLAPAVGELSERERRVLYLRFYERRTQAEIGRELDVSQMQVSRTLTRILTRLRHSIESEPAPGSVSDSR